MFEFNWFTEWAIRFCGRVHSESFAINLIIAQHLFLQPEANPQWFLLIPRCVRVLLAVHFIFYDVYPDLRKGFSAVWLPTGSTFAAYDSAVATTKSQTVAFAYCMTDMSIYQCKLTIKLIVILNSTASTCSTLTAWLVMFSRVKFGIGDLNSMITWLLDQ